MAHLVTLTTDYGLTSPYVAALKGVLLAINPGATLIDLTHDIPPQNIAHVSYYLAGSLPYYPPGSLHLVVVDPGVGTERSLLHIRVGEQQILAPDNGCWTAAAALLGTPAVRRLTESRFWRKNIAHTFHGRDILAPVAGYLSLGITPESLGPVVEKWQTFTPPTARIESHRISGEVVFVDTFGNLQTNIPGEAFRALPSPRVAIPGAPQPRVVRTYGDAEPGTLVALIVSSGRLEIAIAQGNAARKLNCGVGTPVVVEKGLSDESGAWQLEAWDHAHVWHPFTPMHQWRAEPPLIIERGHGCFLVDLDGNEYIDGVSSLWCNVHGHQVPELDAALADQTGRIAHSTLLGLSNVPAIRLARALVERAPPGLTRVFYSDNGATAVEVALKMAFQFWHQCATPRPEKTLYLSLNSAYHGDTLGAVSVGDLGRFHHLFEPLVFPSIRAPAPYCYRCPLGLERATCKIDCVAELERLVIENAPRLAAVVIEPLVQAAAGMITAPEGYLRRVREVTSAHDVLLIADEVAVGFGRTGTLFACQQEDVVPDFLCLAKGLTGGYLPLAATLTTTRIFDAFLGDGKTFYHGHTFTGNPLGAAVALASLERLETQVMPELSAKIARLKVHLDRMAMLPCVGQIRQRGLLAGIELVCDRATKEPFPPALRVGTQVCRQARARGLLIRPLGDVVVVMPPLAIDLPLLDRLGTTLYNCLRTLSEPPTQVGG